MIERSILVQGDLFAYGMGAAVVVVLAEAGWVSVRRVRAVSWIVAVLLGAAVVLHGWPFETSIAAAACAALILVAVLPAGNHPSVLGRALEWPPLRYLGVISYSIYLWHLPVLWWLREHDLLLGATPVGYVGSCIITLTAVVALSSLTYRWVELPAMTHKKRTDSQPVDRHRMGTSSSV